MTSNSESHLPHMTRPRTMHHLIISFLIATMAFAATACQQAGIASLGIWAAAAQPTLRPEEVVAPLPTAVPAMVTPTRLEIPAIKLDVPVVPMGWTVSGPDGRGVQWQLPVDAAGWHVNSAPAGGPGNTVISGSQFEGDAVFLPLALGDVAKGQDVVLTDSAGMTFTYQVTQVLEPLPIRGADAGADATARALVEQAGVTRLTMITGWPNFTTTHRQFVVAELVGE